MRCYFYAYALEKFTHYQITRNSLTFNSQAIILAFNINELLFVLFKIEMFDRVHIKFNLHIYKKKINRLNYDF
jgi:hypothetical protein